MSRAMVGVQLQRRASLKVHLTGNYTCRGWMGYCCGCLLIKLDSIVCRWSGGLRLRIRKLSLLFLMLLLLLLLLLTFTFNCLPLRELEVESFKRCCGRRRAVTFTARTREIKGALVRHERVKLGMR